MELTKSYTAIENTDDFLVAPKLRAGMKEALRNRHGHNRTKDVLTFDDGFSERQAPFVMVARPLLAALMALDAAGEEDEGPDPDTIKDLLEDALVMLGNAHVQLNTWRQRRFSEHLSDLGKRTNKEGIPTDTHLFPDKFHEKIKDAHDHSSTTKKLVSAPPPKSTSFNRPAQPPRYQPFRSTGTTGVYGGAYRDHTRRSAKRTWSRSQTNQNNTCL